MSKAEKLKEMSKGFFSRHRQGVIALIIIVLGVLATVILVVSRKSPERVEVQTPAPLVDVQSLSVRDINMVISGYGTVSAKVEVEITPQVSGNVVLVNPQFRAGGFIPAGKTILKIDPRDYELAVQQAQAAVAEALVTVDTEKAEAAVARKEWDQLNPGVEPTSPLVLREPQIRRAEALLASARAKLATARLNLERTIVAMPIDICVLNKQIDLGQYAAAGRAVGNAYGVEAVEIEVPLENDELEWFSVPDGPVSANGSGAGRTTDAKVTATFAGIEHNWTGYVKRTAGQVDPTSRLISVIVEVPHPYDTDGNRPPLLPGMFVKVEIQGRTLKEAAAIPRYAVHEGSRVWLVEDGRLHIDDLKIARADEEFVYVVNGLNNGAKYVTSSLDVVTDGMKVRTPEDEAHDPNTENEVTEDVNQETVSRAE